MKSIGFGASGLGNLYQAVNKEKAEAALQAAWDAKVRYYDTAPLYGYGLSERRLGDFLRSKPRDEFTLSTKVGRILKPVKERNIDDVFIDPLPFEARFDYTHDGIMRSYEDSLQRLGLSKVDILLVHDIGAYTHSEKSEFYLNQLLESGYRALRRLKDNKEISAIGLGVNECPICEKLAVSIDLDLILLAGRYNLLNQDALKIFPTLERLGKKIFIAGVFASGILVAEKEASRKFNYQTPPPEITERVSKIKQICQKHEVPIGAAAIQFPFRHPSVEKIVIGAQNAEEIRQNFAWRNVQISSLFWVEIDALLKSF